MINPRTPFAPRTNRPVASSPSSTSSSKRPSLSQHLPSPSFVRTNGAHVDPDNLSYCRLHGQFVKRVTWRGKEILVKYGEEVFSSEAEVMRLVREDTTVPVPAVLGVAVDAASGETFIYEELVDAPTLADAWDSLTPAEIKSITSDFSRCIAELAKIDVPANVLLGNYNMSLHARVADSCHVTRSYRPEPTLRTLVNFREWIRFEINRRSHSLNELSIPADIERFLAQGDIGLVHADLSAGNILVKSGRIAAIVDWAEAAWLPRIAEAYTLVTYLERHRCECRAGLQALLATFNLNAETLEGFKILSKALTAYPNKNFPMLRGNGGAPRGAQHREADSRRPRRGA
ncbi:hypothetical protein JCM10049v2_007058 [Rhodotorula toruloides]